jgi:steroid delta-isomerase-like uncharacterized protein
MSMSTDDFSLKTSDGLWFYPTPAERNKLIAQQFFNATWGQGNLAAVDRFTSPGFVVDYPVLPAPLDREGFKAWVSDIHSAFPDLHIVINDTLAEGRKVMIRWTAQGTNTGPIGFLNLAPTGRAVRFTGIVIYRIANDLIVEERGEEDVLGLFRQLGLVGA